MMKMMLLCVYLAVCCGYVFGQNYYITRPISEVVFIANNVERISWIKLDNPELVDVKLIRIELVNGDENNARFVRLIADVGVDVVSYDWLVPNDVMTRSDYFLRMSGRGEDGDIVYNFSARFSIVGGNIVEKDGDNSGGSGNDGGNGGNGGSGGGGSDNGGNGGEDDNNNVVSSGEGVMRDELLDVMMYGMYIMGVVWYI